MSRTINHASHLVMALALCAAVAAQAPSPPTARSLERDFGQHALPFIQAHCLSCHDTETQEAQLDLSLFQSLQDVTQSHPTWRMILERVESNDMPPDDAESQPTPDQRQKLLQWIRDARQFEAQRTAGDPGPVLARRLSNAEYDYSIRDLTGVAIRPTRTFPVDPANEAGFDNSGESLTMSPALMTKYLAAARSVAEHLVLTPRGIGFAPHAVVTDTDRDKYCVRRIVDFYQRQPTDYADYFFAAWSCQHRSSLGKADATMDEIAGEYRVSVKYLTAILDVLTSNDVTAGPLHELQGLWQGMVERGPTDPQGDSTLPAIRAACEQMRDFVVEKRRLFEPSFENLYIKGVHKGSQPFVLWKNNQYAAHRRTPDSAVLKELMDDAQRNSNEGDSTDRKTWLESCKTFCSIFPDAFFILERGRGYLDKPSDEGKGRLLSAGFHSMMGYYRDDRPLYELILDEPGQQQIDRLWHELDFFTAAPSRQYQGFLWFDRTDSRFMRDPEFDFARPENQDALRQPMIELLSEVYLAKAAKNGGEEIPLAAIRDYFQKINRQIRWVEAARIEAEPYQRDAVIQFATRAYRRRLTTNEESELRAFYQQLRDTDGLSHEQALQDTLVSILMSPHFFYRVDLISDSDDTRPLHDIELASRLSYFLWSSVPDDELLQHAYRGELQQPDVLIEQTRRMLQDDRIRGLAVEFGAHWLDFRRFEEHNSVDRERFPGFNNALRSAMFEEPVRFFIDVVQNNRSTLDLLFADHTFVNSTLAKHYGMHNLQFQGDEWQHVAHARTYGRGGLLPMSVFLTRNAPGLRTSPVKRGYWVVRNLLGERIPPPPPDVPDLPSDEAKLGELTLVETLARHRDHESCAGCHNRIDPMGLVFEGFGPIGESRKRDLGGRPVEATATFPDGTERSGSEGLRQYLSQERRSDFVNNLHRKLLSYALGRTLRLSDDSLLEEMAEKVAAQDHRFLSLVETIVTSPQFLNKRGRRALDSTAAGGFDVQ